MSNHSFKKIHPLSLFCGFILILSLVPLCFTATEQLTLTTYYPAPYGMYKNLYTDGLAVGSAYRNETLSDGELIVQDKVLIGIPQSQYAPAATRLEIKSPAQGQSVFRILASGSSGNEDMVVVHEGTLIGGKRNTILRIDAGAGGAFWFQTTGDSYFQNSGNIGIGTNSPESPSPNNQTQGNLDANDIYLRSVNQWASTIIGGGIITVGYTKCGTSINGQDTCPAQYPNEIYRTPSPGILVSYDDPACTGGSVFRYLFLITCSK